MKTACIWAGIAVAVLSCAMGSLAQEGVETTKGTVQELGFGKFRLQDANGTDRMLYLSREGTRYTPDDWRPTLGDEVSVSYTEKQSRDLAISQALTVELTKAGTNTVKITSPVEVEITETGRSGYKAKVAPSGVIVKFSKQRNTQLEPQGWVPAVGEKASVTFTRQTSAGFGIVYALDKMEKIDAGK